MAKKGINEEKRPAKYLSSLLCQYPGKCGNERALKANGQRHWLCAIHRDHQNAMQRARYQRSSKSRKASSKRQKIRDSSSLEDNRGTMLGAPNSRSGKVGDAERSPRLEQARDCSARELTDATANTAESAPSDPPVEGGRHMIPPPASAVHTPPPVSVQVNFANAQDPPPIHIQVAGASSSSVYIVVHAFPPPPTEPTAVPIASYVSYVAPQVRYGPTEDDATRHRTITMAAAPKDDGSPSVLSLNVGATPAPCLQRKGSTGSSCE